MLALHTGQIHPTANYDDPDPACALAGLSRSAQERRVKGGLAECLWIWQQQRRCGIQTGELSSWTAARLRAKL